MSPWRLFASIGTVGYVNCCSVSHSEISRCGTVMSTNVVAFLLLTKHRKVGSYSLRVWRNGSSLAHSSGMSAIVVREMELSLQEG